MKGEVRYEIKTRYFHVFLSRAVKAGFELSGIEETGENRHAFWIPARSRKAFGAFLDEFHAEAKILDVRGSLRIAAFFKRHPALIACALLSAAIIYMLSLRVWVIEAENESIRSALYEMGIKPGARKASVNGRYLSGALTTMFPEFAHVDITVKGVCLYADAYASDPVPKVLTLEGARDLSALTDGVIVDVNVLSGSANVKAGDTVREGDILIYGWERSGKNGETTPVRAEGSVKARVWTQAESVCAPVREEKRFTGRKAYETHLKTPFFSKKLAGENALGLFETKVETTRIVGLFFPVTVERSTYFEYEKVFVPEDRQAVVSALEASAVAKARSMAAEGAKEHLVETEITESGGYVRCEAVIEWILEIAHDKQGG
ncbi:MAG: sporulation protein YqfD [Clostridia bacterium]|nr:sporulation protein YqfD [Clostridia bacterium]